MNNQKKMSNATAMENIGRLLQKVEISKTAAELEDANKNGVIPGTPAGTEKSPVTNADTSGNQFEGISPAPGAVGKEQTKDAKDATPGVSAVVKENKDGNPTPVPTDFGAGSIDKQAAEGERILRHATLIRNVLMQKVASAEGVTSVANDEAVMKGLADADVDQFGKAKKMLEDRKSLGGGLSSALWKDRSTLGKAGVVGAGVALAGGLAAPWIFNKKKKEEKDMNKAANLQLLKIAAEIQHQEYVGMQLLGQLKKIQDVNTLCSAYPGLSKQAAEEVLDEAAAQDPSLAVPTEEEAQQLIADAPELLAQEGASEAPVEAAPADDAQNDALAEDLMAALEATGLSPEELDQAGVSPEEFVEAVSQVIAEDAPAVEKQAAEQAERIEIIKNYIRSR